MADPTNSGQLHQTVKLITDGGDVLPTDATNGLTVSLGTLIAGEDLTNGWTKTATANTPFTKKTIANLFADTAIPAGGTEEGTWLSCDGFTRITVLVWVNQEFTAKLQIRPAADTDLIFDADTDADATADGGIVALSNGDIFGDEFRVFITNNDGGNAATVSGCYAFLAA